MAASPPRPVTLPSQQRLRRPSWPRTRRSADSLGLGRILWVTGATGTTKGIAPLGARPLAEGRACRQGRRTEGGPVQAGIRYLSRGEWASAARRGRLPPHIWFPRASEDASTHSFHSLRPVNERGAGGGGRARGGRVVSLPRPPCRSSRGTSVAIPTGRRALRLEARAPGAREMGRTQRGL